MSAAELLADLARRGIRLEAHGDRLRFRPRLALTPDLLAELKTQKAELLVLLGLAPSAEAERLLTELREALAGIEAAVAAGKAPPTRLAAMRTWLEVGEGFVRDRQLEVARGWDAMGLLRSTVGSALALAECGPPPP